MEGGTRHCRPFRLSKGVKKWRKASRKNTFGISLTPPTGGSADSWPECQAHSLDPCAWAGSVGASEAPWKENLETRSRVSEIMVSNLNRESRMPCHFFQLVI